MIQQLSDITREFFVEGKVVSIFFQNPTNFYKVLLVQITDTNIENASGEIVVTGTLGTIQEEEVYRFFGEIKNHPKYGEQLQANRYEQSRPTTSSGIVQFLSSEKFSGIGRRTAQRVVDSLGSGAIDCIFQDESSLDGITGLTEKQKKTLVQVIHENYGMEKTIVQLNQWGFGNQLAYAIFHYYKQDAISEIEANPYQLIEAIDGIGFKKADNLAENLGFEARSSERIQAAVHYMALECSIQSGNTYTDANVLLNKTVSLLEESRPVEIEKESVASEMLTMVTDGRITQDEGNIFDNSLYHAECGIASSIQTHLEHAKIEQFETDLLDEKLAEVEVNLEISYDDSQRHAILSAINSPLFILTGGPGTGKTTIVNGIVSLYMLINEIELADYEKEMDEFPIHLAAPTGRAAKRMNEATELPASTIHRMLGMNGQSGFNEPATKEISTGLLIVDEMSMMDTWLTNTLLKSVTGDTQIIFVGDKDQLPSINPGQVLHDLLLVKRIPKCELTKIHRQVDGSTIIEVAHEIKDGIVPDDFFTNTKDRSFIPCRTNQVETVIQQVVEKASRKGFTSQDIQVLAPMYRGVAGIDALNKMMQSLLNNNEDKSRKEVTWMDKVYRIGDKIIQLVNDAERNVFNGDVGVITGISLAKENEDKVDQLIIQFNGNGEELSYSRSEWSKITLAYCCSIHKAQGSEFRMVIIPMVYSYKRMLRRNLLYTAITRSKDLLILIGEPEAYIECVTHQSESRQTTLKERIVGHVALDIYETIQKTQDVIEENDGVYLMREFRLTEELVASNSIDPMIGMDGFILK